jgi:hypothetical protein
MIDLFVKWIKENQQKLIDKKLLVSVRKDKKQADLPFFTAAIADVETDKLGGSIIFYHTGECDIDVFTKDENQQAIFIESIEPKTEKELYILLENTFNKIASF